MLKPSKLLPALGLALSISASSVAFAADDLTVAPPPAPFAPVSDLVPLPDFISGLGSLYVDPATLPEGPFLSYDKGGHLIELVFMVPLSKLDAKTNWTDLAANVANWFPVDHVDITYNPGHPGVAEPHYHIQLVAISHAEEQERLAQ